MAGQMPPGIDPTNPPLALNPNGDGPNFDDPPSLAATTYGVVSLFIVLSASIVTMRLVANFRLLKKFMPDDYLCVLAWALSCSYGIIIMTMDETARHAWDIPVSFINESWFKRNAALCLLYGPAMFSAKASMFTLYLRIFNSVAWMRRCSWLGIVLSALFYGSTIPVFAVYSFPHGDETWGLSLAEKASKTNIHGIITAAYNVASDVFLLALPLPIILRMNMSFKKRVGLCGVFLTGVIGLAGTILGLYYRIYMNEQKTSDSTWYAAATYLTVLVELFVTIMVSCAPGCVSSWRIFLRDSAFITTLRSLINSSRESLSRVSRGTRGSGSDTNRIKTHPSESSNDLVPQIELEDMPGRREQAAKMTITKQVDIRTHD